MPSTIYLHVPFCRKACYYCDFHFSTSLALKKDVLEAMHQEIHLQKDYLTDKTLSSVYFGGGTPSVLSPTEIQAFLQTIQEHFDILPTAEITLEGNPDDLDSSYLQAIRQVGVNRLSIGIQSFNEEHLKLMNRSHTATQAYQCVENARQAGFENFSIDLIYAVPAPNHESWLQDLTLALQLRPPHISAYCLTVEPNTVFGRWKNKNKFIPTTDEFAAEQFEFLVQKLGENGYEHYEISNFALPNYHSRHNTNYWKKGNYLGIGASAHSYNGESRQYNISNNALYVKSLQKNEIPAEIEQLSRQDHINEYLLTALRTIWGVDLEFLHQKYNYTLPKSILHSYLQAECVRIKDNFLQLTPKGKLLADRISSDFFVID